jgi:hypothetical protein
MHADEPPTATEVPFKCSLLAVVENVPCCHQEDDGVVAREVGRREGRPSSVASTMRPLRSPSCRTARSAVGIELCRNPAVFVKTRIRGGGVDCVVAVATKPVGNTAKVRIATARVRCMPPEF